MNNTTSRRLRCSVRAAAVATTAAVILGAAACGTETASDNDKAPSAPAAPPVKVQTVPYTPRSADAAERWAASAERRAAAEAQERYLRYLLSVKKQRSQLKHSRPSEYTTGHHRDILLP